jgi:DUF917 family protein
VWEIREEDVEDIATGAAILGTGGGGDPFIGKLMAIQAIREHGPVRVADPDEVPDDALVIPSAMMGAPTVMVEKIPKGDEPVNAFQALERHFGKRAFATMSIEAGGLNSTVPLGVAARLGIPLVDADGMGRAFPEIQMVTPTMHGVSATPMSMADEKGNALFLHTIDNKWTERLSRVVTVEMGGSAIIALYAMDGSTLRKSCVLRSMSRIRSIGRELREARRQKKDAVEAVLRATGGFELFRGKIVDVERRTLKGFARGTARLDGLGDYGGEKLAIDFQNENLVARSDGDVVASVPDLITVLDAETGQPVTTEGLRYGYRCVVISIPCDPKWRTPEGLALVGPRYFGYDVEYEPIERRLRSRVA